MHLSSIFSFDTCQVRLRPPSWIAFFLTTVIVMELALRIPFFVEHLPRPEPSLWHAEAVQTKLDYLKAFESQRGIEVLFIGNSTVLTGMDPEVFDAIRGNRQDYGPGAFNGAFEGLPPYGVLLFLEIYLRYSNPHLIIYGITPQDLNSNSPWAKDVTDRVNRSPLAQVESQRGLQSRLTAALLEYSRLYRYRQVLFQGMLNGGLSHKPKVYFNQRGFQPDDRRLKETIASKRAPSPRNPGVLNYSPEGLQLESLRSLLVLCRSRGINVVLVNMPLADQYYNNFDSPKDYQTYVSAATRLAYELEVPILDLEGLPVEAGFDNEDFFDFNHLNRYGAEKLSKILSSYYVGSLAGP